MMNMKNYGIPNQNDRPGCVGARVTAVHRERFEIATEYGFSSAKMKRGLQLDTDEMPTVGDRILVEYNPGGESVGVEVLPRTTLFARQDSWHGIRQLIAANFDYVLIATSLNEDFSLRRLERYLALARESGAQPVFLLTKRDLTDEATAGSIASDVRRMASDCPVICLSVRTGRGIDALKELMKPGTTSVLMGSSGVGKSSLVNALMGEEVMATKEIREDDSKGRHTTVHRQMLLLPWGALLIDTPGMRELAMWDAAQGVDDAFAEIAEAAQKCRFRDCTHIHEPGCAVLAGIESGLLDADRVANYLKLRDESDMSAVLARKFRKSKEISKANHARKKSDRFRR